MVTILAVDDEPMILDLCSRTLGRKGYTVIPVQSVREALEHLERGRADLIISDIRMPEITGVEFLQIVDERWPDTPFIFVSGYATLEITLDALKKGASGFLVKPFSVDDLERTVERVLEVDRIKKENARLRSLVPLVTIIREMAGKHNLESLTRYFVESLKDVIDADEISLCPIGDSSPFERMPSDRVLCDHCAQAVPCGKDPLEDPLVHVDRDAETTELATEMDARGVQSFLCYCVRTHDEWVGKIIAVRKAGKANFSAVDEYAFDILCKQFEQQVETMLYNVELQESLLSFVDSLVAALEARDAYTGTHGTSVSSLAVEVGKRLNLSDHELELLEKAGKLHDIGKIGIPDIILLKPGKLTDEEFKKIEQHPVIGYEILAKHRSMREVAEIVRHHHEWYSGGGYPDGLKGEEIPLLARIVSVCDALHALMSDRPYRPAFSMSKALEILESDTPKKFDPRIVAIAKEIVTGEQSSAA